MPKQLLPFDPAALRAACEELDRWQRRLAWKDWHGRTWSGRLRRDVETEAVAASTMMEGVPVTEAEVRRILAGDRPPQVADSDARLVEGYRDAMRFAQGRAAATDFRWTGEVLIALNDGILGGASRSPIGFADRARYVVAPEGVRFEAPPAARVRTLVDTMCGHLNERSLHAGVAAAWVHVATAAIHPFPDGNGRTARVLASLAMQQGGFRLWAFTTLESWWGRHPEDYYEAFACLGSRFDQEADVTPFMITHLRAQLAQVHALDLRDRVEHRIWEAIEGAVADVGLDDRVANAVWEAFFERDVTAGYYQGVAEVSPATATHDLRAAVASGLLSAQGQRRGRRYLPGPALYERVGQAFGIGDAGDRAPIIAALTRRVRHEEIDPADQDLTLRDAAVRERRVEVHHLHRGRDSAIDVEVVVWDNGLCRGSKRGSLSPEAWMKLGDGLGHTGWRLPSPQMNGEAARVVHAFVELVERAIDRDPPDAGGELKVSVADDDALSQIASLALEDR